MIRRPAVSILASSSMLLALATGAPAQPFEYSVPVIQGDAYLGSTIKLVKSVAVDDEGRWMVHAELADEVDEAVDEILIRDGVVVAREGDAVAVPGGGQILRFVAFGLGAGGSDARICQLTGTAGGASDDYVLLVDGVPVVQDGAPIVLPGFDSAATYGNMLDIKVNAQGEVLLNGTVSDPLIPGDPDEALVRLATGTGLSATIAKEGDELAGNPGRTITSIKDDANDSALNADGDAMFIARLDGDPATADAIYLLDDDQGLVLVAQMGGPAPGGSTYQSFAQRGLDVNGASDTVFRATRADGVDVIVRNGAVFVIEGDPVPGKPGETISDLGGAFLPVEIDDQGRVLWWGRWVTVNGPNALFLEDAIVLESSVTSVAPGITFSGLDATEHAFHVSDGGEWIIAKAITAPGGKSAAVLVRAVPEVCQTDLGFGGPGTAVLSVCGGDLSSGTSADLLLTGAPAAAPAFLLVGLVANPLPFAGGTLVPIPYLLLVNLVTDGDGQVSLPGVPGGGGPVSIVLQALVTDAAQPKGFAISNALQVDVLP